MMPGQPLPNGWKRFHVAVQCFICSWAMYCGRSDDDMCRKGEMTCTNTDCPSFGTYYKIPTVDAKRSR